MTQMRTMDDYVATWRQRQQADAAAADRLARRARSDAAKVAAMLRQEFGARRILLFGSLARGRFGPGSDIDLAAEGMARADYFAALGRILGMTDFWVDLKPLEDLETHFRERVLATGEDL